MNILLAEFVNNFMIVFGMIVAMATAWYNFVTKPQEKKDDKASLVQEKMLHSQNELNNLLGKVTNQMTHQSESHNTDVKRIYQEIERNKEDIKKDYLLIDKRVFSLEDIIYVNRKSEK